MNMLQGIMCCFKKYDYGYVRAERPPKTDWAAEKVRKQNVIDYYAHDYRDMKLSEYELKIIMSEVVSAIKCEHKCTSNCRRVGCNCNCGEYHTY
jgi:hypothetical protein